MINEQPLTLCIFQIDKCKLKSRKKISDEGEILISNYSSTLLTSLKGFTSDLFYKSYSQELHSGKMKIKEQGKKISDTKIYKNISKTNQVMKLVLSSVTLTFGQLL